MYSIKPGRGPSIMGGVGGIVVALFGIFWTFGAVSMGAPTFFALFGIVFVVMSIIGAMYNFYNATSQNRMSTYDITTDTEERDPIEERMGFSTLPSSSEKSELPRGSRKIPGEYCPFCGCKVASNFNYCPKCGKDI